MAGESPGALRDWLGDTPLPEFMRRHLGREPVARPSSAAGASRPFGWEAVGALLQRPGLDALVVRGGREAEAPLPRSSGELRRLLAAGLGVVVRRAERHDAGLAALGRSLARDLPGRFHVQLFATPAGGTGFGWRYDAEEVFVVQARGEKHFYFRRNTVAPDPASAARPDFGRVREETTPLMTCTLLPGDWLYLPRGWWHAGKARTHALSISLGIALERAAAGGRPAAELGGG